MADAQCAGRRGLLHARGDVDGDAADGAFGIDAAAEQHAAGVDADADVEPVCPCWRLTELAGIALPSSARPQRTARSASSSRASSAPNTASRLSPAYCSTLPWWASTMAVQRASAPSITAWISSGSRCWLSAVEPTTSRKRMLTWRSDWAVSAPGLWLSGRGAWSAGRPATRRRPRHPAARVGLRGRRCRRLSCSCSDDIGSQDKPVSASDGTDSRPLNDWFGEHGWESATGRGSLGWRTSAVWRSAATGRFRATRLRAQEPALDPNQASDAQDWQPQSSHWRGQSRPAESAPPAAA